MAKLVELPKETAKAKKELKEDKGMSHKKFISELRQLVNAKKSQSP